MDHYNTSVICDHYGGLKSLVLKEHYVLSFTVKMFQMDDVNV